MSNQEVTTSSPVESRDTARPVEIIHFPKCDVVINNDADRVDLAHKLAELFKEGVPQNWEVLAPEIDNDLPDYKSGPKPGMAKGMIDGVEFLLKPKAFFRDATDYLQSKSEHHDRKAVRFRQRVNSVLNEMRLSQEVKQLAASPGMQDIAKKYGYLGIKFVEPVIAIIYKNTGRKYLVYEYVPNTEEVYDVLMDMSDFATQDAFDSDLKEFFAGSRIEANEADTGHLLIDKDNMLNIVDIESFQRKTTSAS